jgi:hypothetical protein
VTELSRGQRLGRAAGLGLFGIVALFYLASGLVVPTWPWLIILNVAGAYALVMTIRLSAERWWIALFGPVLAVAFWFAYVNLGSAFLGWTA